MQVNFILRDLIIKFYKDSLIPACLNRLTRFLFGTLQNKFITNYIRMIAKIFHVIIQRGEQILTDDEFFG
ncbi:hypothetical protein D3C75_949820 [compost metagenome]